MGGVINILTREPADDELVLQGGGGSYGTYRANAFGSYAVTDAIKLAVSGGRNHTDGFMQIEPDVRGPINVPTAFTSNNGALRGDFALSSTLKAHLRVDYFDNDQTLQTHLSTNAQRTWNYSGTLDQSFGSDARLALTVFGSDSDFTTQNTGGLEGVPENEAEFVQNVHHTPVQDVGASLVWSHSFSRNWLRSYSIGVDIHRISGEDLADIFDETGAQLRTDIGRGKQRFTGGFVQASIRPIEPLEILASARYQSFDNFDAFDGTPGGLGNAPDTSESSVDPRVSLRYALSGTFALRAAYYTAFRAPTLDNLYRAFSVPFGIFYANPALVPETLKGGELGFDVHTSALRLQATAYDNIVEDLITSRNLDFSELPPGFFFGSRNINAGKARSRGVELETQWQVTPSLSTQLAYTYADSKITANDLDPASVGLQIGSVPRNRASVAMSYSSPQGWRITPQFRWVQASFADNDHTLPVDAQRLVDVAASYPFGDAIEAFVRIENLFNEHYIADNSGFNPPLRGTPFSVFVGARMRVR
jgi:outer membrane receptor protein involved in Fe transport